MFGNNKKLTTRAFAVVTGAGSGIGRAFAVELAQRGGEVLCSDIDLKSAQETADSIKAEGGCAWALKCDVSLRSDMEALAEQADALFSEPVNLVINNAGVGVGGKNIGDISLEDWEWTMGINLWGVIHGCHVFAPRLKKLGRGGIINVASSASFAAAPLMGPYNVTKAGVLALSETLAAETAGTGVNVTVLCPTVVNTNIFTSGRIHGGIPPVLNRLIELTGVSADGVAKTTLNALDRGQLHVLPQFDARMIWRAKRYLPATYTRGAGLLSRLAAAKR